MRTKNRSITQPQTDPQTSPAKLTFPCTVLVERRGEITRHWLHGETTKSWIASWLPGHLEKLPKNQYRLLEPEESERQTWIWNNNRKIADQLNAICGLLDYSQLQQIAAIIGYEEAEPARVPEVSDE